MYRIAIADDEAMECKVLEKMIIDHLPHIQVLPSSCNGIELLARMEQTVPDIAVVDITMPGLNGLDAIEIISKKYPSVKILVVSAYSKFEYAQKALSLGASDYLLKPVKEGVFLDTLQKLCSEIDAEKRQAQKLQRSDELLKNYLDAVENEFISEIILEDVSVKGLENYLSVLSHPFFGAFILSVHFLSGYGEDLSQAYLSFLENLKKISTCLGRIKKNLLILCLFPSSDASLEIQRGVLSENIACALKNRPILCSIGVSALERTAYELSQGLQESRLALLEQNEPGICFWNADLSGEKNFPLPHPGERDSYIRLLVQKQYDSFYEAIAQTSLRLEHSGKSLSFLQIYFLDLIQLFFQTAPEKSSESPFSLYLTWIYWEKLLSHQTPSGLRETARRLMEQYLNSQTEESWNRHILGSLTFISDHYMEDLSLDLVAEKNKISSFYLSRLFKQELDHTFLELLTDLRISKAIQLLFQESHSVQEISESCGYLNTSYFYKLFKKQTGMTIGEMRHLITLVHTLT